MFCCFVDSDRRMPPVPPCQAICWIVLPWNVADFDIVACCKTLIHFQIRVCEQQAGLVGISGLNDRFAQ